MDGGRGDSGGIEERREGWRSRKRKKMMMRVRIWNRREEIRGEGAEKDEGMRS